MPNGKTHDKITLITTPIVAIGSYIIFKNYNETIIVTLSFLFASLMFNGDLDTNSSPYNRWFILKMIWIPYQLMFEHRSIFTHGILIGTVVRLIYVGIIVIPILIYCFHYDINSILCFVNTNKFIIFVIGLEIGSSIHTISDKIF